MESLTDLRAFALAASADIRRCEIVTHGAEHSNVLDHSPVPAERRVMASIVTANFDRNNVTPIRLNTGPFGETIGNEYRPQKQASQS